MVYFEALHSILSLQAIEGLDFGEQSTETIRYLLNMQPKSIKQLIFLQSILSLTLRHYFDVFSSLPTLIDKCNVEEAAFVESVDGVAYNDAYIVVDALHHLGIVQMNESNFLELCDEWNSAESVEKLMAQMSKFVTL